MAGISRFDQQEAPARFNPLSFQELAYAPITLRNREDAVMDKRDEILDQMNNLEVLDIFQKETDAEKETLKKELSDLATKIQKEGAGNINYINDFRNLKNKYNQAVSKSGNIGRAVGANENVKAMKDAYFADAYKKGQQAQDIERNWQAQLQRFKGQLPESLADHKGQVPEMMPEFAPNNLELADKAAEYSKLMTGVEEEIKGTFTLSPSRDPNTGQVTIAVINHLGEEMNNTPQVEALKRILTNDITNEHSDLNQNLKYKGINPQDYLSNVQDFATLMHKVRSSNKNSIQFHNGPSASGGTKKIEKETPTGTFSSWKGGRKIGDNTGSVASMKEQRASIENDTTLTDTEKNTQLAQLNIAEVIKTKKEESPEFTQVMDEFAKSNTKIDMPGANTIADIGAKNGKELLESVTKEKQYERKASLLTYHVEGQLKEYIAGNLNLDPKVIQDMQLATGMIPELDERGNIKYSGFKNRAASEEYMQKEMLESTGGTPSILINNPKFRTNTSGDYLRASKTYNDFDKGYANTRALVEKKYQDVMNPLLEDSNIYFYNIDSQSTKNTETIQDNLKNIPLDRALNHGMLTVKNEKGWFQKLSSSDDEGEDFINFINNTPKSDLKYEFNGIYDGGNTDNPSIMFKVFKKEEKGTHSLQEVALELQKGSDITNTFLNPQGEFYTSMDEAGKAVLNSIKDKLDYGAIATDITKDDKMFDKSGTANIKSHVTNQMYAAVADKKFLKSEDTAIYSHLFVNPRSDDDYSMLINRDEPDGVISFSMYSKSSNGDVKEMTFDDYINKEAAVSFANDISIKDSLKSKQEIEGDPLWNMVKAREKAEFINNMVDAFKNLDDINDPANSAALFYSYDPKYISALKKANNIILNSGDRSSENTTLFQQLEDIFDKEIAPLPIRSKSRKLLL